MIGLLELTVTLGIFLVIGAINEQWHEGRRPARGAPRVVTAPEAPVEPEPVEAPEPSDLPARTLDGYRTGWTAP